MRQARWTSLSCSEQTSEKWGIGVFLFSRRSGCSPTSKMWLSSSMNWPTFKLIGESLIWSNLQWGTVCVLYINKVWCRKAAVVTQHCSPLFQLWNVGPSTCQESTAMMVTVYLPPSANANYALAKLHETISNLQTMHPEELIIIAGYVNHVNLKSVLPRFFQHVNFTTRGDICLDIVDTNTTYKVFPHPHLGYSDQISVLMVPACKSLLKSFNSAQ